jgi:mannose-1-phosphate guanylyltransferase / mannose-6-phosphate isomerase
LVVAEISLMQIIPIILCGGSGTRLWPVSRDSFPKQFVPLMGLRSTFQATLKRVDDVSLFGRPLIVTNEKFRFLAQEQADDVSVPVDILMEPTPRDSAPAIAAAAEWLLRHRPGSIGLVLAADHMIGDVEGFRTSVRQALPATEAGRIVTFGIVPSHPSTAYGYIQPGDPMEGGARHVAIFLEKPDAEMAKGLVEQGYLWNSGNFMFKPDVMMAEIERHVPEIAISVRAALDGASDDLGATRLDEAPFAAATKISIDYAVMQKTFHAAVVRAAFDWSDIGTWGALWDASEHDEHGNRVTGNVSLLDTRNSLVHSDGVLTAVTGVDDIVVVATRDAVLVTSRENSGEVKILVEALKAQSIREASEHLKMFRPWGAYQRIDLGDRFQVKRITVKPGGRLSLQKHFHRSEHWVVVSGTAEVTIGDKVMELHENQSTYIPIGEVHRLANPGRVPLEIIEVQVGSYTGEDDIVRIEDVYGRG